MSLDAPRFAAGVDRLLGRITPFGFAGAILVAHGDDVLLRRGYGLADRANGVPNTAETVFCLGSITKQFTAAAVIALAQEGKLDPGDLIADYFDSIPVDKAGITLHHLLTHTAGVRNYTGPDYEPASREEVIVRVMETPLLFEPGSQYEYANAGYSLLAAIVEIVAGRPFEQFLYERLLRPACLEQTGYTRPDWSGRTVAHWYTGDIDNGQALEKPYPSWNIVGNGEMLSTIDDVFRWHRALLGNELLDAESKARMYTPFLHDYAYGWRVQDTPYGRLINHNGASDLGSSALLRRYVDAGLVIVLFCNQAYGEMPMILPLQDKLDQLLAGEEIPLPPEIEPASRADLAPYVGEYDLPGGGHFSLTPAGNVLMLHARDQRAINHLAFPDLPPEAHEALNAEHARVFAAALAGDLEPLRGFLSNAEERLDPVARILRTNLAEAEEEYGRHQGLDVVGTVPSSLRAGALDTIVVVRFQRGTMGILSITQGGVNVGVAELEMAQGWALPCIPFGGKLLGYHLPLGRVVTVDPANRTE